MMWTHLSAHVEIVWDDAIYRIVGIWREDPAEEPYAMEKGGTIALGEDRSPEAILAACIAHAAAVTRVS
jgi:hypothetical protein